MKGKFITTLLQLAVLSGSKKPIHADAAGKSSIENFQIIWSKEFTAKQNRRTHKDKFQELQTTVAYLWP